MAKPININELVGQYVASAPGVPLREVIKRTIQKSKPGSEPTDEEIGRFLREYQKAKTLKEAAATASEKNLLSLNRLARKFLQDADPSRPVDDRDVNDVVTRYADSHDIDRPLRNASADIQFLIKRYIVPNWASRQPVERPQAPGAPAKTKVTRPAQKPVQKPKTPGKAPAPRSSGDENPAKAGQQPNGPVKVVPGDDWGKQANPAAPKTFFDRIRLKMQREGLLPLTRKARSWLKDKVYDVGKAPQRKTLLSEGQTVAEALIGQMFFFFYDPKTKNEMPFWDKFPMVFPIHLYEDGFLGLNLHYLDQRNRLVLFDKLMELAENPRLDRLQRLNLSYSVLKNVSQFPEVRPTIKRYLTSHVKSQLLRVDAQDWEIALFLPVENFQKSQKEGVWAWSKLKMQNAILKQKLKTKV